MNDKPDGKHAQMEKYLLRKAFDRPEDPYLPEDVLWRQKEQFSDGVGYNWVDGLKDYAQRVCCPVPWSNPAHLSSEHSLLIVQAVS
jgi:asparagine synthase (glutamine-hydrolysing)